MWLTDFRNAEWSTTVLQGKEPRKRHEEIIVFNETAKAEIFWLGIEMLMHNMGYISFSVKKWKQPWFFLVLFCIRTKKNNDKRVEFRISLVNNEIRKSGFSSNFLTWPKECTLGGSEIKRKKCIFFWKYKNTPIFET